MIAVIGGTVLVIVLNPQAPQGAGAPEFLAWVRKTIVVAFMLGVYANLLSLGLSGWIRSRSLGIVSSVAALIAAIIVSLFVTLQ